MKAASLQLTQTPLLPNSVRDIELAEAPYAWQLNMAPGFAFSQTVILLKMEMNRVMSRETVVHRT